MKELNKARLNIGVGWFVLLFCIGLLDLPLRYYLKQELHLSASSIATFFALANIPIYIKPIMGFVMDIVRLRGVNKLLCMVWPLLFSCLFYIILGNTSTVEGAFASFFVLTFFLGLLSITLGAMLVEYGKKLQNTGKLSSLRIGVIKCAVIIGGPVGGYLATKDIWISTSICAALMAILIPIYMVLFREKETVTKSNDILSDIKNQFQIVINSRILLMTVGLVFVWKIAPGFITPLWYHQTETLHFTPGFIGLLTSIIAAGGILGAVIYGYACKYFNLRVLLVFGVIIDAIETILYIGYNSEVSALIITSLYGITSASCALPLYDLAARATPKKCESLGYALILSVWNLADALSDVWGTKLYDDYHMGFNNIIWIHTISTIVILLFIPLIPKSVTQYTDK